MYINLIMPQFGLRHQAIYFITFVVDTGFVSMWFKETQPLILDSMSTFVNAHSNNMCTSLKINIQANGS